MDKKELEEWREGVLGAWIIARKPNEGEHTEQAYLEHRERYERGGSYAEGADILSEVDLRRREAEKDRDKWKEKYECGYVKTFNKKIIKSEDICEPPDTIVCVTYESEGNGLMSIYVRSELLPERVKEDVFSGLREWWTK